VLSNQQLYLVNHFALVARRQGVALPDLKELLRDEVRLRQCVEGALADQGRPALAEAAAKVAAAMSWPVPAEMAAAGTRPPPRIDALATPSGAAMPSPQPQSGLSTQERAQALAALQDAAGPIASFIAEQVDALGPTSLGHYLDQAATLAQLGEARRRALRAACGLGPH
jgi:hypothetical protein